ncbi:alpha/beta hydrolase [Saccharopolyspora sp. HNM0986]|uniref:alpha/beta hydrolase n=1 Tax=Saccharopolyspora galaxeae TaxID=2781241 RepID=UPI00190DAA6F|nr:alpha/beta hydrolase [Saccharopolyspora sp. HNM0986]MBK0866846.1 alpha/beta hydrolase [Saccharopolyspora sp. HNM0986]
MALDKATADFLAQMAETGAAPMHTLQPQEAREMSAAMTDLSGPGPQLHEVRDTAVFAADGAKIAVRVLRPAERSRGVLVYLHGGGWVIGSVDQFDTLGRVLAQRTGCTVVLVEYRLAPEHRYPVAVDDAWAALRWSAQHVAELTGGAGGPLVVAGDSAGGNLAAVLANRAKTAGDPQIAAQVLVYPVTDADLDNASYTDPDNQLMLTRDTMVWFWDHYVPDIAARAEPDASPLRCADLAGSPPAIVLTAEHDVLRDEGEAYAEKLRAAGVAVQLRRFSGQMHGFFQFVGFLPGGTTAIDYVTEQLEPHLNK